MLAGIGPRECQELPHAVGLDLQARHQHEVNPGDDADGNEIAERIVGETRVEIGIDHEIGIDRHEQGVAVGRGARDLSRRQAAVGTGLVLDDHRLAQGL
ncbi:MAG TPA: hypothetical protein VKD43_18495, partial [Xanthobacteraceae bacterium]|nr:hypothetical protein [Xanthobacteraceae bacterium]